jgi:hypothetical protein
VPCRGALTLGAPHLALLVGPETKGKVLDSNLVLA